MGAPMLVPVTIANGTALSAEVDLGGAVLVGIQMPAAWTAANLTFQAAEKAGGTFNNVYNDAGTELTVTAAAARHILLASPYALAGMRYLKVRSGTSGVPVNQAADRAMFLLVKYL